MTVIFFCRSLVWALLCVAFPISAANREKLPVQKIAKSSLFWQGGYAVRQIVVPPQFEALPFRRKMYAYQLSRAIDAGDDIIWQQTHRLALPLRHLLEKLWRYSHYFSPNLKAALAQYTVQILTNHGNFDLFTRKKITPDAIGPDDFATLVKLAQRWAVLNGVKLVLDKDYQKLQSYIFDVSPDFSLALSDQTNLYGPGVTEQDIERMPENERDHSLSTVIKNSEGQLVLRLHRLHDRFGPELERVSHFLEQAQQYAYPEEVKILEAYRQVFRTADMSDLRRAEELWALYNPSDIDFIIGFVETFVDPLGKRAAWEGSVYLVDNNTTLNKYIGALRSNIAYFEQQMPVDDELKRPAEQVLIPLARFAFPIHLGGRNSEYPLLGKSLPNDPGTKRKVGTKSIIFRGEAVNLETAPMEDIASTWSVLIHEVVGHHIGVVKDKGLRELSTVIEEAHADLSWIYFSQDPKILELGVLPNTISFKNQQEMFVKQILNFFNLQLWGFFNLREVNRGDRQLYFDFFKNDYGDMPLNNYMLSNQIIFNFFLEHHVIQVVGGKEGSGPRVEMTNASLIKDVAGQLWNLVQTIRGTGDYEKAKQLVNRWGQYNGTHEQWRHELLTNFGGLFDRARVYLTPTMTLVVDDRSQPVDVALGYRDELPSIDSYVDARCDRFVEP